MPDEWDVMASYGEMYFNIELWYIIARGKVNAKSFIFLTLVLKNKS